MALVPGLHNIHRELLAEMENAGEFWDTLIRSGRTDPRHVLRVKGASGVLRLKGPGDSAILSIADSSAAILYP